LNKNANSLPHVVILGAGASIASFLHSGKLGKNLPSMNDLIEVLDLKPLLAQNKIDSSNLNFEAFYDDISTKNEYPMLKEEIERRVYSYFYDMELPDKPTIYDYLILSLREKDLIATFNWDPFLLQAYRRNIKVKNLPQLALLHGSVKSGFCTNKHIGYVNEKCPHPSCNEALKPVKLLYPVKHKNYSNNNFIRNSWNKLRDYLKRAYYITVFGYSAPVSDVEARAIMLDVWKNNPTKHFAEIDFIDIMPKEEIEQKWSDFIVNNHYGIFKDIYDSYLFKYPRRSCESFSDMTLNNNPRPENPFPAFNTLAELHNWIKPLLDEEENLFGQLKPSSR